MNCCEDTFKAAEKGHLECLKTLYSQGVKWDFYTTSITARNGHLECLKYAHKNGCEWHPLTIISATENGHLECLKYAHENGFKFRDITWTASRNGQLECLKYAHENECEWSEYTDYHAAYYGHLECLFYCLENGCPIHPYTLSILCEKQTNKNLLTNLLLRKILLHPKMKNNITEYQDFVKAIQNYEKHINKVYKLLHLKTTLPTDIIKYELLKYL